MLYLYCIDRVGNYADSKTGGKDENERKNNPGHRSRNAE